MNDFARGQKGKLADLGCNSPFTVELDIAAAGMAIDVSCFGVDNFDKLSDERYMVFYNQLASPEGAVKLDLGGGKSRFAVNLEALPASIAKLVFVAAIDGNGTMRAVGQSAMNLGGAVRFPWSGADFQDEKAVIVGEIYRKDGVWRFGAVGQGFNGGLSALLAHFGGAEMAPAGSAAAPVAAPAPASKPVSLSKVTLEKRGDKVSLDKRAGQGFGRIHVNLNWNQNGATAAAAAPPAKTGFLAKLTGGLSGGAAGGAATSTASAGIDLDLGCMFEMADGKAGLVQALGNAWGEIDRRPYIRLETDDRTGQSVGGENLFINGDHFNEIKRALVFAFIYKGAANWAATDGVVTIDMPGQAPIEVRLDQGGNQRMCAIAMIENVGGRLQVTKLAEYFAQEGKLSAHESMDRRFGFGLRWKTGTKD
jgi:tellurite resistance protein TerA